MHNMHADAGRWPLFKGGQVSLASEFVVQISIMCDLESTPLDSCLSND